MQTKVHTHIHNWLAAGADAKVGLQLFLTYCNPNPAIQQLVSKNPDKHIRLITTALCTKFGIQQPQITDHRSFTPDHRSPITNQRITDHKKTNNESRNNESRKKLRDDWPFLSSPSCPAELKILVGDKITAYHNYVKAYNNLHTATNVEQQYNNVRYLVENYIENHIIHQELHYYKEHKKVLGKHPVFAHLKKLRTLRHLPILDLVKKKTQLEHNIWRNKNKIQTDNRPDLQISREKRIRQLEIELAEIMRLLE